MTYPALRDRTQYQNVIETVLGLMNEPNDNPYMKGEFFGFFVNRFLRRFLGTADYTQSAFNSTGFNESKRKTLENVADKAGIMLNRGDPMSAASDMSYVICAIYWGFMGKAKNFSPVGFGMKVYIEGILDKIRSNIETVNSGNQRDATMAFRRHLIIRGVLQHVKSETDWRFSYLQSTRLTQEGDIWEDGELVLSTQGD